MKIALLAAAASAAFATAPLLAQPAGGPPTTRAEMEQRIQQRFAARDANHDGFMTSDELGPNAAMVIEQLDTDHDGKISLAEATARTLADFDAADANHDGTLTDAEREAAHGRIRDRPAQD